MLMAVVAYVMFLRHQNTVLSAHNDNLTTQVVSLTADKTQLQADIDFQNEAVTKLKVDADNRRAKGNAIVSEGRQTASSYKRRADILSSTALTYTPTGGCKQADTLINEEIKNAIR